MAGIQVEHAPPRPRLHALGVFEWPIESQAAAIYPWRCEETETFYLLEGDVIVVPESGQPFRITKGDLVTVQAGTSGTWAVRVPVRRHFHFNVPVRWH